MHFFHEAILFWISWLSDRWVDRTIKALEISSLCSILDSPRKWTTLNQIKISNLNLKLALKTKGRLVVRFSYSFSLWHHFVWNFLAVWQGSWQDPVFSFQFFCGTTILISNPKLTLKTKGRQVVSFSYLLFLWSHFVWNLLAVWQVSG